MRTSGSEASFGGPRVTVFILGGVTFSEMKAAYDVTKQMNRQVIIGMCIALGTAFSACVQRMAQTSKKIFCWSSGS